MAPPRHRLPTRIAHIARQMAPNGTQGSFVFAAICDGFDSSCGVGVTMQPHPASHSANKPSRAPAPAATLSRQLAQRIARLVRKEAARVFTPADFLDMGTPHAVGMALSRMVRAGALRRVARGLYDVPRSHSLLGPLSPSTDALVRAVARRDGVVMQPLDVEATNLLGLSEQVVAKPIYETNGPSRTLRVGGLEIELRHRSPRRVTAAAESSNLVFAALRGLGKAHVTLERVAHLQRLLGARMDASIFASHRRSPRRRWRETQGANLIVTATPTSSPVCRPRRAHCWRRFCQKAHSPT